MEPVPIGERRNAGMTNKKGNYQKISEKLLVLLGGKENIQGVAYCATRLRIVLTDHEQVDLDQIGNLDLVKGVFVAGDQLQIIFGAGTVNDVYEVFTQVSGTTKMSLGDVKAQSIKKQNGIQKAIKSLSDVFVDIIPGLLAAALLMGLTGLLEQQGIFGSQSVIEMFPSLAGINRFLSICSTGIFTILPMLVVYSATRRYGGTPVLGLIIGAIMLHPDLANAYSVGNGTVEPEVINIIGLNIELVAFQGGIIIALMMGFITAKLDIFFNKKIPDMVKLFFAPLLTVVVAAFLLFTIIGPVGRTLADIITYSLLWATTNLGVLGYMLFAGIQQIIVITGIHHVIGAVEAQLIADTGHNFIMPLMSVALIAQGGAVLGYLVLNWKNDKTKQICISSFGSVLFGISEPAIFGVTLKNKFPLIAGCFGAAFGGAYIYVKNVTAIGFGATAIPGIAIVTAEGNGHLNYIIAHLIALVAGFAFTYAYGKLKGKREVA